MNNKTKDEIQGRYNLRGLLLTLGFVGFMFGVELEIRDNAANETSEIEYAQRGRISYIKGTDIKHGREAWYNRDGQLLLQMHYINGRKEGREMRYTNEGELIYDANYKNNKLDGLCQEFYPGYILKSEILYRDGKMQGKAKWFYESGALEKEADYDGGVLDGKVIEYYKNGKVKLNVAYKQNKIEGVSRSFFDNGKVQEVANYRDGLKHGDVKEYSIDGILLREIHYGNDVKKGREKIYDDGGRLIIERNHNIGETRQTEVKWFYADGKPRMQMLYDSNQAIWQKNFNEMGELVVKLDCKVQNCISGLGEASVSEFE